MFMKYKLLILILLIVITPGCKKNNSIQEEKKVKEVLADYFKAIQSENFQQMKENTTPDYLLFENGKVWNNDSLWNEIQRYQNNSIIFKLDGHKILLDGNLAHIAYFNHGNLYQKDSLLGKLEWIENATLKKIDGKWKIFFLHSTPRN